MGDPQNIQEDSLMGSDQYYGNVVETIKRRFSKIIDFRQQKKVIHEQTTILFITIFGLFCLKRTYLGIYRMAKYNSEWLKKVLKIELIPSMDTIRRYLMKIDGEQVAEALVDWGRSVGKIKPGDIICGDGKTIKNSHKECQGKNGVHVYSFFVPELFTAIALMKTESKDSELHQIDVLLDLLDINGCTITMDAGAGYPVVVEKIIEKGGDYIIGLKKNELNLFDCVSKLFTEKLHPFTASFSEMYKIEKEYGDKCYAYTEKSHGRLISKRFFKANFEELEKFDLYDKFKKVWKNNISSFICVEVDSEDKETKKWSRERSYYFSNLNITIKEFAEKIRKHWMIESMHWDLDATFKEDYSPMHNRDSLFSISMLRRYVLSLCKRYLEKGEAESIPDISDRFICDPFSDFRTNMMCGFI